MTAVSLVLPCLNEAESVGPCIDEALTAARSAGLDLEVVVVDNGSTDGSAEVATKHGARVVAESRPGYGSALKAGIAAARGDVIVMADADQTYPLERIPDLVAPVRAGEADIVIGERLSAVAQGAMPFLHRFVGTPVLSFLVRRAAKGISVADSQSGFRAFSAPAIRSLGMRSDGMEFASEMLIRAGRRGLRVTSIDTGYRPRVGESKLNTMSDGWRHLQLIGLMAPQLLLLWPGLVLTAFGTGLTVFSLLQPFGIAIGSLRWQPVFFSGIAVVIGVMAALAGAILTYHSSVLDERVRRQFAFVGRPSFSRNCVAGGVCAFLVGVVIDVVLFVLWVQKDSEATQALPFASLAQSLILSGAASAILGVANALINRELGTDAVPTEPA